ncbi:alcohol dehydrogenase [Microbacterium foliorum]|uniref:Sorbitol dehydrogenase n=1 Tax=Microbacterium foliorum TaxID=104336 RepID=A0A0F0KZT9_9MICO|nr:alcohol dehydrogenase catalytic domain-containing protein [Microbacterium foliorum]AXL12572.1 alcohol dehydrogenase [Microbacterium foliorum]KJL26407.1 Sorbitol dehydrogenase [Microbacterium foliorum]
MGDNTYRAIIRHAGASAVIERRLPEIAPGDLLLAPEAVSLCGTDHQMLRGIRNDPSPVLGHEGACRIVAGADSSGRFHLGQRVTVNPTNPQDPSFLLGHNIDGLFQQRVVIPRRAVEAGLVVPIDEGMSSSIATLIEPLAVVDYALACLRLADAETLVVLGDGLIGNLAARRAADNDTWAKIIVAHATSAGYRWTDETWDDDLIHNCMEAKLEEHLDNNSSVGCLIATHRDRTPASVDRIHEAAGTRLRAVHVTGGVAPDAVANTLPGIDLAGIRAANTGGPWPPRRTNTESNGHTIAFTGNRGVMSQHLTRAAADLTSNPAQVSPLISHVVDMDSSVDIMNRMVARQSRHIDGETIMRLVIAMNPDLITA